MHHFSTLNNMKSHVFMNELRNFLDEFVSAIPGRTGINLRHWYFSRRLKYLGPNSRISQGILFYDAENISLGGNFSAGRNCSLGAINGELKIGDYASLAENVQINASQKGRIVIGNYVMIAPNVVLRASDHVTIRVDKLMREQGHSGGDIVVEDDVWIASNVVVVADVRIGKGAVVAAGAVVTKDVEPYTVVGGVPAKFMKKRGDNQKVEHV
jgi:galactoside O-acetyltransferase